MTDDGTITLHHRPDGSAFVSRQDVEENGVPGLAEQMDVAYPRCDDGWVIPARFLDMARAMDARRRGRLH